jgi:iron complex outermembrane receptor protein
MDKFRLTLACLLACVSTSALAQSADGTSSEDAFGRLVGLESIGLYDEGQVRGFNLENAGNYRIEGNYFARVGPPLYLIRDATTVRIGVNDLRYDFPAPSGVVEYDLRRPQPGASLTIESGRRAYSGPFADVVGNWGRDDGTLGIIAAVNLAPWQRYANGAGGDFYGAGAVGRWSPVPSVKLTAFGSVVDWVADPDTGFVPLGEFLPPKVKRGVLRSQPWTRYKQQRQTVGLFGSADLGSGWKLSGGLFHSAQQFSRNDFNLAEVASPAGDYHALAFIAPRVSAASQSGSLLLEHSWGTDKLRQRLVATVRLRETVNRNAPSLQFDVGDSDLAGSFPRIPEPEFTIEDRQVVDRTKQTTVGAGYRIGIGGRLELRADVQKTDYSKTRTALDGTDTNGSSKPWLYSASALFGLTPKLTVSGSYSRGLEESGVAPSSTVNRGEVLPAVLATQRELGARYSFTPSLSLIAGLFDTRKPTPGIGPDGRFDLIAEVRHRGFEASLAGALTPRLNIVAGVMLLDATLSGPLVDDRVIGRHAVARPDHTALLNLNWRPKWVDGLSFDATVTRLGRAYISSSNITKSELQTTLDLGARYRFRLGKQPVSLRARVLNLFNSFYWQPDASGTLYPNAQRDFELTLQTEF